LAISALATAAAQLDDERYLVAARDAADAVLDRNKIRGVLSHYSINRKASNTAFLDGYACFINALLDLYTATLRSGYLFEAIRLSGEMIERFGNSHGLSYNSGSEFENAFLPARPQRLLDTFIPSAKALALQVLRRLEQVHPSPTAAKKAEELEHYLAEQIHRSREGMDYTLHVASEYSRSRTAIVLVGSAENARTQELAREARRALLPGGTLLWAAPGKAGKRARSLSPLLKKHNRDDGKPTAFFCRDGVSYADVTRVEELVKLLREVDMPKNDAPK
jgi:uncharacterized protein YyaL (SSP411 family)